MKNYSHPKLCDDRGAVRSAFTRRRFAANHSSTGS